MSTKKHGDSNTLTNQSDNNEIGSQTFFVHVQGPPWHTVYFRLARTDILD